MNDDFINKFIDHRCSQLGEIGVLFCQSKELLYTGSIFLIARQAFLRFCNLCGKVFLFDFVLSKQAVKAFLRNSAYGKGFIELLMIVSSSLWRLRSLFSFRLASLAASTCLTCEAARIFSVNFPDLLWQAG